MVALAVLSSIQLFGGGDPMYAKPCTKWACPITIPRRNQLTIKTLTLTITTLRQ